MSKPLRFFIAGIIQGSLPASVHPQDYRREIKNLLLASFPGCEAFEPVERYPDSLAYDDETAKAAFFDLMDNAGKHDVLIAFLPEASMGTAIELWSAYNAGALVISVTHLERNWAIRYLSDLILPDIRSFERFVAGGGLAERIREKLGR
ncbi:MAG: hypothetical protein LBJ46_06315 [Planctomycetota bacterium]|nr:hypothetical protein [Planctomycetota bacterium]